MKAGKHQRRKTMVLYSLCWKLLDRPQSFIIGSQIAWLNKINAMILLVSKFKMIGMLLIIKVMHCQVHIQQSSQTGFITFPL